MLKLIADDFLNPPSKCIVRNLRTKLQLYSYEPYMEGYEIDEYSNKENSQKKH